MHPFSSFMQELLHIKQKAYSGFLHLMYEGHLPQMHLFNSSFEGFFILF